MPEGALDGSTLSPPHLQGRGLWVPGELGPQVTGQGQEERCAALPPPPEGAEGQWPKHVRRPLHRH